MSISMPHLSCCSLATRYSVGLPMIPYMLSVNYDAIPVVLHCLAYLFTISHHLPSFFGFSGDSVAVSSSSMVLLPSSIGSLGFGGV